MNLFRKKKKLKATDYNLEFKFSDNDNSETFSVVSQLIVTLMRAGCINNQISIRDVDISRENGVGTLAINFIRFTRE